MGRTSWATSARFHDSDSFQNREKGTVEDVLIDYGLPPTGFVEDRTTFDVSEEIRRCRTCEMMKPIGEYSHQTKVVGGKSKTYYGLECRPCKKQKKETGKEEIHTKGFRKAMADAPMVAAVRLLDDRPEALALLIKHFKSDFVKFYELERQKASEVDADL